VCCCIQVSKCWEVDIAQSVVKCSSKNCLLPVLVIRHNVLFEQRVNLTCLVNFSAILVFYCQSFLLLCSKNLIFISSTTPSYKLSSWVQTLYFFMCVMMFLYPSVWINCKLWLMCGYNFIFSYGIRVTVACHSNLHLYDKIRAF
jgi:hypothetical protein